MTLLAKTEDDKPVDIGEEVEWALMMALWQFGKAIGLNPMEPPVAAPRFEKPDKKKRS